MRRKTKCIECTKEFERATYRASFCGGKCRRDFNNRRATRGAILYDLAMLVLDEKDSKEQVNLAQRRDEVLASWRAEDAAAGRKRTWQSKYDVLTSTAKYSAERF